MGCCNSVINEKERQMLIKDIKISIQSANLPRLLNICKTLSKSDQKSTTFNTFRFRCLKGKYLNIPAYCLYLNKPEILKILHNSFKIDFTYLDLILNEYDTNALSEICINNHLELLEFYLPFHLQTETMRPSMNSNITLDLRSRDNSQVKITHSPIQLACEKGHIPIVNLIYKYFEGSTPPPQLDINHPDLITGENCALIACRQGNYSMIRFLHLVCNADFIGVNNKNESAIQILASASKQKYNPDLLPTLKFLVEKAGVNILHGYEETLLILENNECVSYVEGKLAEMQIFVSKLELEYTNRLIKRNSDEIVLREVTEEKNSLASTIEPVAVRFSSLGEILSMLTTK